MDVLDSQNFTFTVMNIVKSKQRKYSPQYFSQIERYILFKYFMQFNEPRTYQFELF